MKAIIFVMCIIIFATFSLAHGYYELPSPNKCRFENSTVFVCCPAIIGGFPLFFPLATVGLVADCLIYPFNQEVFGLGVLSGACCGTVAGQWLLGGPFYLIEEGVKKVIK